MKDLHAFFRYLVSEYYLMATCRSWQDAIIEQLSEYITDNITLEELTMTEDTRKKILNLFNEAFDYMDNLYDNKEISLTELEGLVDILADARNEVITHLVKRGN